MVLNAIITADRCLANLGILFKNGGHFLFCAKLPHFHASFLHRFQTMWYHTFSVAF